MPSKQISRLYIYSPNTTISSSQHNAEHNLFVDNLNEIFSQFISYNPTTRTHYFPTTQVVFPSFSSLNLDQFLQVAHNSDGTIKSSGIGDPVIQTHNSDPQAHRSIQITTAQLVDGSVTSSKLASGAVTTEAIADGSVTSTKLAGDVQTSIRSGFRYAFFFGV